MTSRLPVSVFLALVGIVGVIAGHFVCASRICRNEIGLISGRGALVAMVEGVGVYECDIDRAEAARDDRSPDPTDEPDPAEREKTFETVVANLRAEQFSVGGDIPAAVIDRQFELEGFQFQPKAWLLALRADGLSPREWRCDIARNLRAQSWIEGKIQSQLAVRPEECAACYQAHAGDYAQPFRIRVRHIFFAAPPGSAPELIEAKRSASQALVDRIGQGAKFADLVGESEDEASKKHGGDLGFLAESRVPADFWAAVKGIPAGAPISIIRTILGFHVVQVSDSLQPRQISQEEASPGIFVVLQNERRAAAVRALVRQLALGGPDLQIP